MAQNILLKLMLNEGDKTAVASIPISGGRSLHPAKNKGRKFVKIVDQNFPPIFTRKLHP